MERRIVMSQYLTAVNSAGSLPPQEEGLFSNSWNGKFHLEMHAWHAAHFAVWGRPELLERSMPWYFAHLEEAKARAKAMGVKGAWWPKMVGPEGRESPSTVNPWLMWQQPHPIYLAETLYNVRKDKAVLEKYQSLVFETADLLLTPTTPGPPHGHDGPGARINTSLTWAFNLSGHPAISIPAGFDSCGLPVGLQAVARHGREADLLAAARAVLDDLPDGQPHPIEWFDPNPPH